MSALLDLAERCEAATGPDTTLDCLIENEAGLTKFERDARIGYGDADYSRVQPKPYTASLDAAMTLIDADIFFHVSRFSPGEGGASAHVYPNRGLGDDYEANAATPALALCAAALRARAAEQSALNREGGNG